MKRVTIQLEEYLWEFYQKIGQAADGVPLEQVLHDALFQAAGEWSAKAREEKKSPRYHS